MTPLPRTRAVPLVLALLLAGCAPMGPDYRRPSLEIAPQFRAQAQAQARAMVQTHGPSGLGGWIASRPRWSSA